MYCPCKNAEICYWAQSMPLYPNSEQRKAVFCRHLIEVLARDGDDGLRRTHLTTIGDNGRGNLLIDTIEAAIGDIVIVIDL